LLKALIPRIKKAKILGVEFEITEELKKASEKSKVPKLISNTEESSLVNRIEFVKSNKIVLKALWVDDNPSNNYIETKILEEIGIKITTVTTSEEALRLLQFNNFHLILSDILRYNDESQGKRFIIELNEIYKIQLPTIFYTSFDDKSQGTPPYAFAICDQPVDLVSYCLDIMERNIKNYR